jgi:pantetheine-phosphate adenylyltransferase
MNLNNGKSVIYSGSFDPATYGHLDLINRAEKMFPDYRIVVAVANNYSKNNLFTLEERTSILNEIYIDNDRVEIYSFDGLLVNFAKQQNANIVIRGLRAVSDFEYELQLALTNRKIGENIETIFMMPNEEYSYLSSSLVREVSKLGGEVSQFVHPIVERELKKKFLS